MASYKRGRCLLKPLLKKHKLTQAELARRIGVKRQMIGKYIRGESPMTLDKAKSISEVLGCTIEELYEWIEE